MGFGQERTPPDPSQTLRSINLYGCETITDEGIAALNACKQLNYLGAYGLDKLTTPQVLRLMFEVPALREADVGMCPQVSAVEIRERFPHITC